MAAPDQRAAEARRKFRDPFQLAPELRIKRVPDDAGSGERVHYGRLRPMRAEQQALYDALADKRNVLVLKCRRLGITTACLAYLFAKTYGSPKNEPRVGMSVAHAEFAVRTLAKMTREFHRGMPPRLRCELAPDNQQETGFRHNGGLLMRELAGSTGEGRSGGLTDVHFTEMAFYRRGVAAKSGQDGNTEKDTYQSMMAAMDDPNGKVIIESTGNGPRGHFYDMTKVAKNSDNWAFLFFPWHHFQKYSMPFVKRTREGVLVEDEEGARRFQQDLSDFEQRMMEQHALSLSQVRWMRSKLVDEDYDLRRFLREYPFTELDPFLLDDSGWFNQESLQAHLSIAKGKAGPDEMQVFAPYDPTHRYFMGVDTAGGVGRDEAVIQIVRDDLVHCMTWRSDHHSPYQQAEVVASIGAAWGQPLCLVEANKYGKVVIEHLKRLGGVKLYRDRDSADGNFWMNGGRAGYSKRRVYDHAGELINREWCVIHHPETIVQAQRIVEKSSGRIEAEGGHDDLIDAFALALWCARERAARRDSVTRERQQHAARMRHIRGTWGLGHRVAA